LGKNLLLPYWDCLNVFGFIREESSATSMGIKFVREESSASLLGMMLDVLEPLRKSLLLPY